MEAREITLLKGEKEERDQYIGRVDVLEKVKELNTLAGTDYMTTQQVADFYEAGRSTVNQVYVRFSDELDEDGVIKAGAKELENILRFDKLSKRKRPGGVEVEGEFLSYNANNLYSKRAVLRVGMLLRGSQVAKEVRSLLLNVYHDVEQGKTDIKANINKELAEEQIYYLELGEAVMSGDLESVLLTSTKLMDLKNKRIGELEEQNMNIIETATTITGSKKIVNALMRNMAVQRFNNNFPQTYTEFYRLVNYKLGVNIKRRNDVGGSYLNRFTEEELKEVERIARSWTESEGMNVKEIIGFSREV